MPSLGPKGSSDLFRYAGVGMQFSATIGVFALIGHGLDRWLGTDPWLMIAGVFLGFGGGLYSMILRLGPSSRATPRKKPDETSSGGPRP